MNKQENENDNQTIIEDLPVDDERQDEVKGGMETMKKAWKDASSLPAIPDTP